MSARLEALQKMLEGSPDDPFLHYAVALEHQKSGKTSLAVQKAYEIMKSWPDYLPVYYTLATWLISVGKPEDSRQVLTQGLEVARKQHAAKTVSEIQSLLDEI